MISQENLRMVNKKFHSLEPQSIWVVVEDRVEAVVDAVYANLDATVTAERALITLLH